MQSYGAAMNNVYSSSAMICYHHYSYGYKPSAQHPTRYDNERKTSPLQLEEIIHRLKNDKSLLVNGGTCTVLATNLLKIVRGTGLRCICTDGAHNGELMLTLADILSVR